MRQNYLLCILFSIFIADETLAGNFSISLNALSDTVVYPSGKVSAYYTVTNNTSVPLNGYTVVYSPSTAGALVSQNTSNPTYCSSPITLNGQASCTLQLDITAGTSFSIAIQNGTSITAYTPPVTVTQGSAQPLSVVAGYYSSTNYSNAHCPLLAQTTSKGQTWAYALNCSSSNKAVLPSDFKAGQFFSASCGKNICVAAGSYQSVPFAYTSPPFYPLSAQSTNGGASWNYAIYSSMPELPVDFSTSYGGGQLNSASANDFFVAAGNYGIPSVQKQYAAISYPILAQTTNQGNAWDYTIYNQTQRVPSDFNPTYGGYFVNASCSDSTCVAVGTYATALNAGNYFMLAQTMDAGSNWTYPIQSNWVNTPTDLDSDNPNQFTSSSCIGTTCIAAGFYSGGDGIYFPIVAQSQQSVQGGVWQDVYDNNSVPSDYDQTNQARFNGASCSQGSCAAAGYYNSDGGSPGQYPLVAAQGTNGTWQTTFDSSSAALPADFSAVNGGGLFNSISCSGLTCVAAGEYYNNNSSTFPSPYPTYPYAAYSSDGGQTWNDGIDSFWSALPSDFNISNGSSGLFISSSCQGSNCIVAGCYTVPITTPIENILSYPLLAQTSNGGVTWKLSVSSASPALPPDYANLGNSGIFQSASIGISSYLPVSLKWISSPSSSHLPGIERLGEYETCLNFFFP